jgi:hypothetical protein
MYRYLGTGYSRQHLVEKYDQLLHAHEEILSETSFASLGCDGYSTTIKVLLLVMVFGMIGYATLI